MARRFVNPAFCAVVASVALILAGVRPPAMLLAPLDTITLVAALPTMSAIAMFTARRNTMPEYAVGFVLVGTLCSLFTLTAVSALVF